MQISSSFQVMNLALNGSQRDSVERAHMWSLVMVMKRKKLPKHYHFHFGGYRHTVIFGHCTQHLIWNSYEQPVAQLFPLPPS